MNLADMRQAISEARTVLNHADSLADTIARMLVGRLRHVSPDILKQLKKELRDYNMHTYTWNDR